MRPAAVLLSGGLDSATALAVARAGGYEPHCLTVDYGQRHRVEIEAARAVAAAAGATSHRVIALDLRPIGGSSLTTHAQVPKDAAPDRVGVPSTYVPARNTILLSLLLALAEVVKARDLFIGATAVDFSGYPDCRPEFLRCFADLASVATAAGVEGGARFRVHAPLLHLGKADIIRLGVRLGVDFSLTHSCYDPAPNGDACARCDSCQHRRKGFVEAGFPDPTRYAVDPAEP